MLTPEQIAQIRSRGLRHIEDMRRFLGSLEHEFKDGPMTSIYVREKTINLEERCDYLRALAARVDGARFTHEEEPNVTHP